MIKHDDPEVQKAGSESTTITHASFTPYGEGKPKVVRGSSRAVISQEESWSTGTGASEGKWYTQAEGSKKKKRKKMKKNSKICKKPKAEKGPHTYANSNPGGRPHTSHTESRILEDLWDQNQGNPGPDGKIGKVVLNINWQQNGGWVEGDDKTDLTKKGTVRKKRGQVNRKDACKHCQKLIRKASACFDIVLCDDSGRPPQEQKKSL